MPVLSARDLERKCPYSTCGAAERVSFFALENCGRHFWSGPRTSSNELDRDLARHPHALLEVHEVNGCFERSNGSCSVLDNDFIRRLGAEKQFLRSIQARAARRVA